jgi:hypothetical protein
MGVKHGVRAVHRGQRLQHEDFLRESTSPAVWQKEGRLNLPG